MGFFSKLVGAATGGLIGESPEELQQKELQRRAAAAAQKASPEEFLRILNQIRPQFREQILAGLGPQLQQKIGVNIARGGLKNTGIGKALSSAAIAIPEVTAFQAALREAGAIQRGESSAAEAFLRAPTPVGDPLEALAKTAGAISGFKGLG